MTTGKESHGTTCREIEPRLGELAAGELSGAEERHARAHLASCASCASELAAFGDLLASARELPREAQPAADLWPGIEARLAPRRRSPVWPAWLRQAAAAVLFMALGGALSQLLWPGWRAGDPAPPGPVGALDPQVGFALAEADYLRAKDALWAAVYHGRRSDSPETREVVERNLRLIDQAIRELREALSADPGNRQLEGLLLARHRSEIDLLRRLRKVTADT